MQSISFETKFVRSSDFILIDIFWDHSFHKAHWTLYGRPIFSFVQEKVEESSERK